MGGPALGIKQGSPRAFVPTSLIRTPSVALGGVQGRNSGPSVRDQDSGNDLQTSPAEKDDARVGTSPSSVRCGLGALVNPHEKGVRERWSRCCLGVSFKKKWLI